MPWVALIVHCPKPKPHCEASVWLHYMPAACTDCGKPRASMQVARCVNVCHSDNVSHQYVQSGSIWICAGTQIMQVALQHIHVSTYQQRSALLAIIKLSYFTNTPQSVNNFICQMMSRFEKSKTILIGRVIMWMTTKKCPQLITFQKIFFVHTLRSELEVLAGRW